MNLKKMCFERYGLDFPISGGSGYTLSDPIIIHNSGVSDYIQIEYSIINCIARNRELDWEKIGQELLNHKESKIDRIKICTKSTSKQDEIHRIENYYFDITDCFNHALKLKIVFDELSTLALITDRMKQLENMSDFNRNCIDLVRKKLLFKDIDLTAQFLIVLLEDESLPLFKSMLAYKNLPIMLVLDKISNEL
jgi:hypothetical protein